ncbi:hypothetical protein [Campylobacter showae]|nr:hypothetical protein [Campylobacter showae]
MSWARSADKAAQAAGARKRAANLLHRSGSTSRRKFAAAKVKEHKFSR